ncbi:tautomerase family protein [Pseudomonas sp. PSKL.D1]|uniref:tautomerase family protein n=1 Tax=Pseudomonas sp. PSKL.D1 TaxID=3029060 RepID=UPI002381024F|nr:tautomerase family protein [Pseudomonas sp. PSKL.D1]WDY55993.1 tautomerase family protein [Pseudomonas sp. PSKL.D1]
MPLVRIDIVKHPDPAHIHAIGQVVYASLRATINVPEHDNFQVLTEHERDHLVNDPQYLGIQRTEGQVFIQITLSEGRTVEQKKALYLAIAQGLERDAGVRPEDVFINLVEVRKENWSFGNGIAQYAL